MRCSFDSVKYHQELIDEWNDPEDIVQRAAVVILKTHQIYGQMALQVFKMLQNKSMHPKKISPKPRKKNKSLSKSK